MVGPGRSKLRPCMSFRAEPFNRTPTTYDRTDPTGGGGDVAAHGQRVILTARSLTQRDSYQRSPTFTTGLPAAPVRDVEIDPINPQSIWAATEVGIFHSADGGATCDLPQDGPANVSSTSCLGWAPSSSPRPYGRGVYALDLGVTPTGPAVKVTPNPVQFPGQIVGTSRRLSVGLVRAGQTVTASVSSDGNAWTTVGQDTIAWSGAVWVGLAITSHDNTKLGKATFDHVAPRLVLTVKRGCRVGRSVGEPIRLKADATYGFIVASGCVRGVRL